MSDYISREAAVKIAQKYGLVNGSALGRHTGLADCIAIERLCCGWNVLLLSIVRCKNGFGGIKCKCSLNG